MKIAVVGSYGVGMTMRVPHFPGAGETVSGGGYAAGPGGKGSNQAIGAARLGADVTLLTSLGPDHFAEEARALWARENVRSEHVVQRYQPTMVGFILVNDEGENEIAIAPGALTELVPDDVEAFRDVIREADIVAVSMEIPVPTVCAALRIAHDEGTPALLNPAPASPLPDDAWQWISILTPNQSEAAHLLGLPTDHDLPPEELLGRLALRTDAVIVLTLGSDGCAVWDGGSTFVVPPIQAREVVDTTGAGDTFTAALAVAIAEGQPVAEAVRFASAAGAYAVTHAGVIDALPTREQVSQVLQNARDAQI